MNSCGEDSIAPCDSNTQRSRSNFGLVASNVSGDWTTL